MLANVPWDSVDNIIIPVNVCESFHWILVVFRIKHRCLYVYDSLIGGVVNSKNVYAHVQSLATMIPMFLVATDFYGKRTAINWQREPAYIDKSMTDPLEYVLVKDAPQQAPDSKYGALLWDYARRKQDDGAISESEVTGNVTSKLGGVKSFREAVPKLQIIQCANPKNRKM